MKKYIVCFVILSSIVIYHDIQTNNQIDFYTIGNIALVLGFLFFVHWLITSIKSILDNIINKFKNHNLAKFDTEKENRPEVSEAEKERQLFIYEQRRLVTPSMRYYVFARDGFRCQICGATQADGVKLHVDHIFPVSKGGRTEMSNLRTLCDKCNLGKGDKIETVTIPAKRSNPELEGVDVPKGFENAVEMTPEQFAAYVEYRYGKNK